LRLQPGGKRSDGNAKGRLLGGPSLAVPPASVYFFLSWMSVGHGVTTKSESLFSGLS
jgi:hypothetical protein